MRRSVGFGQELRDHSCRLFIRSACPMGVDLHRRRPVRVTEACRDRRDGNACVEQLRRLEMAQIVQSHRLAVLDTRPCDFPFRAGDVWSPGGSAERIRTEDVQAATLVDVDFRSVNGVPGRSMGISTRTGSGERSTNGTP